MIRYFVRKEGQLTELEEIQNANWINISPPIDPLEIEALSERFDIPADFFTDPLDTDERSRYEIDENCRLVVLNTPVLNNYEVDREAIYVTQPIGIILVSDLIITVSNVENPILRRFLDDKVRGFNPADRVNFILKIFEQNALRFLECLKKLNLQRNEIERELFDNSRNEQIRDLLRIEKSLVYFVNSLSANELLLIKMKRVDVLMIGRDEQKEELYEDILIDNGQALEMANVHTNIISGTMQSYSSWVSNNVNIFIQRLTVITIILMVPTLVASFYGMNVSLPFENKPYAFYLLILFSFIISLFLVWIFRKKRLF